MNLKVIGDFHAVVMKARLHGDSVMVKICLRVGAYIVVCDSRGARLYTDHLPLEYIEHRPAARRRLVEELAVKIMNSVRTSIPRI